MNIVCGQGPRCSLGPDVLIDEKLPVDVPEVPDSLEFECTLCGTPSVRRLANGVPIPDEQDAFHGGKRRKIAVDEYKVERLRVNEKLDAVAWSSV